MISRGLLAGGLLVLLAVAVEAGARWMIARRHAPTGAWWRKAGRPVPPLWRRYWWEFVDPTNRKRNERERRRREAHRRAAPYN